MQRTRGNLVGLKRKGLSHPGLVWSSRKTGKQKNTPLTARKHADKRRLWARMSEVTGKVTSISVVTFDSLNKMPYFNLFYTSLGLHILKINEIVINKIKSTTIPAQIKIVTSYQNKENEQK